MSHRAMAMLATTALALAACSGSSSTGTDGGGNPSGNGTMTATVDGVAFNGALLTTATLNGGVLIVQGEQSISLGHYKLITIGIGDFSAPGTFSLALGNANGANALWTDDANDWSTSLTGGTGSVTVTAYDATHVAGTFSFTASSSVAGTNPVHVTNGQFDIKFKT